jgi:hypothetical protein
MGKPAGVELHRHQLKRRSRRLEAYFDESAAVPTRRARRAVEHKIA